MENYQKNLEKFIERNLEQLIYIENLTEVSPFLPDRYYIEPTNACNLRCVHCHHNNLKKGVFKRKLGMMDFELYKQIIDEISEYGSEITLNVQGEPLLHKEIIKMVEYSKSKGMFTSILTNATLLSKEVSTELINLKLDRIVFSFDSINKEEYEQIRIRANFEKTLLNILYFLKINEDLNHPTFVCCSIIPQNRNKNSIKKYDEYFYSLPIDTIFHSSLLNLSGNSGIAEEVDESFHTNKEKPVCRVPWEMITINWDGEVTPCGLDFNVLYSIGNVKTSSIKDLWNNDKMRKFRKAHLDSDFCDIEKNGTLCSNCNCLYDPEYNIKNYKLFVKNNLVRKFEQYSIKLCEKKIKFEKKDESKNKYKKLLSEIKRVEKCLQ